MTPYGMAEDVEAMWKDEGKRMDDGRVEVHVDPKGQGGAGEFSETRALSKPRSGARQSPMRAKMRGDRNCL